MDGIESLKQLEMLDINNENFDKSYGNGIVDSSLLLCVMRVAFIMTWTVIK